MYDHQQEELNGTIDRFLFQSTDTGFSVFVLSTDQKKPITVRGYLSSLQPGQDVTLKGKWVTHPKFGQQFEASSCMPILPTSKQGLIKYLGSGMIRGIGKTYAQRLVDWFGEHIIDVIEHNPDRLKEVVGIGEKRIEQIVNSWKTQKDISRIMIFLQDKGISPAFAAKIYKKYGNESIAIVQENPYRLADEVWGIGFKIADQIARQLGISEHSPARIKAGIIFAITSVIGQGHLYVEAEELKTSTCTLLELIYEEHEATLRGAFHDLYIADKIKIISHENKHFITLAQYYGAERGVATYLKLLKSYTSLQTINFDECYTKLRASQEHFSIELNDKQQHAIISCLQNKISIITGGPGTGKTTVIKTLLHFLGKYKVDYKLAAPTGRAAKRMMEGTGRHAETIHRLLSFDVSTMKFVHNAENTLKLDFLIIDEASMIDIFLAHAIVKAVPRHAHIVFIGDIDQLPSVGAGNFLKDLINSKEIACIQLNEIFRQARDSMIVVNAHRVNKGEFPTSALPGAKRDFIFIKEEEPTKAIEHINKALSSLDHYNIPIENSIVLVPMNKGIVGTQQLNQQLQSILNPDATKPYMSRNGTLFRVGDRIMQIRNNYDKFVFNGDIGIVGDINTEEKQLVIKFNEKSHTYEFDEMDEIVLAYAVSIHKSQGSEYDAAIIPIFTQHFALLQRNLIYTAITRAKKLCILIGQPRAIAMAIKNNKSIERKTFLKEFLTTDLQCRS